MRRFSSTKASCFLVCWVALVLAAGLVARRLQQARYNFQSAAEPVRQAHLQGAITREFAEVERHAAQPQLRPLPHHRQQSRPRTARAPPASRAAGLLDAPPNVPDVWDVLGELTRYEAALWRHPETREGVVRAAQHRTTAAELGILPSDNLSDLASVPTRIAFLNQLADRVRAANVTRLAVVTTWGGGMASVRRDLLPWMQIMTELGVSSFYVLYDGTDSAAVLALSRICHVTLQFMAPPFASEADQQEFAAWEHHHWQWGNKPGNFRLMVKQGFGMERGLRLARQQLQDWLMHIDPDEIVLPTSSALSLATLLRRQPDHVSSLRFMNIEGQAEAGDLTNRFEQVTLFRTHQHHALPESYKHRFNFRLGGHRSFLNLYANTNQASLIKRQGKSVVRVVPGVQQLGPHYWRGAPSHWWKSRSNPHGQWQTRVSEDALVLHYAYSYRSDVADKAAVSCPDAGYLAAARRGDRAKVKDCFVIDLDQDAYMVAATGNETTIDDFWWSRMVLTEGSRVRCKTRAMELAWCMLRHVEHLKSMLMRINLLKRIHVPSVMLKQHERQIEQLLFSNVTA